MLIQVNFPYLRIEMYPPPDVSRRQSVLSRHHLVPGEECPRNLDNASVKVLLSPRNYNEIMRPIDSNWLFEVKDVTQ